MAAGAGAGGGVLRGGAQLGGHASQLRQLGGGGAELALQQRRGRPAVVAPVRLHGPVGWQVRQVFFL